MVLRKVKPGTYPAVEIQDFIAKEGKSFTNFKATAGWSTSTLNRGMLPTAGASQSLFLEATVPGSDLKFYRLDYDGQYFKGLWGDHVLRFHTRLGYAESYGSTSRLPFYENYYAGGFDSVRGFRDGAMGPRSTYYGYGKDCTREKCDPDRDFLHFGGNVLIEGGVEWIFPMPFVKDQRSIRSYAFWDVGNVFDTNCSKEQKARNESGCSIKAGDLGSAAGLGLTWVTAMGPLSFSVGRPIKKPDNSKAQFFQFTLGQTF